ncbi:MAG TPA: 5-guanidino-2-oxopentanoate decarboxylase [Synergistales bacterium]|nr:5-guanidino-2-oxopentanoate decarboxylase [Synergistales bacterium]
MISPNGARLVVSTLESLDVSAVFGIPGIHNLDIYSALTKSGIRHITARHEQGAGFMADGYARSTGRTGVALVISGPGLTNILTPMAQALHDSIPMLVISSQIPTPFIGKGCGFLHELPDSTALAQGVSKKSFRIGSPEDIPVVIKSAWDLASDGRPGPVHVEIPMDVLGQASDEEVPFQDSTPSRPEPLIPEDAISRTANLLDNSSDPVIIAGGGSCGASGSLSKLAEISGAMVIETCAGKGIVDERHPLCLGARSHFPCVREALSKADLILAFGTELSPTDLWEKPLPGNGTLVQVDLDPANFSRNGMADIGITADANEAASALLKKISSKPARSAKNIEKAIELKEKASEELAALTGMGAELDPMCALVSALREAIPEEGVLFADMTGPAYVAISEYPAFSPRTFLHPVGFGTLGLAMPAAIGAAIARPSRPVCVMAGDGGFQFTLPELAVAVQERLSVPIVIWNDKGFGEIRRNENARHPGIFIAVDNMPPDLGLLASAYGAKYSRPGDPRALATSIRQAFSAEVPTIIECAPGKGGFADDR